MLPLGRSGFGGGSHALPRPDAFDLRWRFGEGSLRVIANFGSDPAEFSAPPETRVLWRSPGAHRDGGMVGLPSWTGMVLKDASA